MKRYRWFSANWSIGMRALARQLKANTFDESSAEGFVVDRVRDEYLEARFIERFEYDDDIVDPFGKEFSFHRVEYRQFRFRATTSNPGLELVDAPRSMQTLVSRLAQATNFSTAISPVSVDVLSWAKGLQTKLNLMGTVDSLQIGAIELEPGVVAKVVIKGSSDVVGSGARLTKDKKHSVEKLQLRFNDSRRTSVILTNSAVLRMEHEPDDVFLSAVRESLGIATSMSSIDR